MPTPTALLPFVLLCSLVPSQAAQAPPGWQRPPEPIASLVEAAPSPSLGLSPDRRYLVTVQRESMPGIDVLAAPHLKLAGLRIDAASRGPQLGTKVTKLTLRALADGSERTLALPMGHIDGPLWSADGAQMAFTRAVDGGRELWLCDSATGAVRQVPDVRLTAVLGNAVAWLPDQRTLLLRLVVRGAPPPVASAPSGPDAQETAGKQATVRTYQDLLRSSHDEDLFAYYGQSQLARLDSATLQLTELGAPALFTRAESSPDGQFLLVACVQRPFSFAVPYGQFPGAVAVWDRDGRPLRVIGEHPLLDTVPIGGVAVGPRAVDWLPAEGHALVWTQALDGGDPKRKVPLRDECLVLTDLAGAPRRWFATEHRLQGLQYGEDQRLCLVREFDRDHRRQRLLAFDMGDFASAGRVLQERSAQDSYSDPGRPVVERDGRGQSLLRMRNGRLFLSGAGAGKGGERPFLDAWDPGSGETRRLFTCAEGRYEEFVGFLGEDSILIASESPTEPRNYVRVQLADGARTAWTHFADAAQPLVQQFEKTLLHYQRQDGVQLSGTLFLPPGADPKQPLPCLVWAYPQEFNQSSDAGQVRGSPNRYTRLAGTSHLWLLLAGYAVLDGASMPIVGPVRTANDTFVQQLVANAEATVQALAATGRIDTSRLCIAGHSYGAFMTANLLAHSDLFAAGIARSGAYNRTLTPFGFQNEERTYWQAQDLYQAMSPFSHANDIDEPLLMIHGGDDNNPGTFPMQSERLFAAIAGHGGTARLCMLPHESHGYRARESVQQCLWEMVSWMDRYVKPGRRSPAPRTGR